MILFIAGFGVTTSSLLASTQMFDPVLDDPDREWCYAANSTTVIGKPFVPEPVQVTYDGAVYTRYAELCFFYGSEFKPVLARQKTFHKGWIPIVQYQWTDGSIEYALEIFSTEAAGLGTGNLVQFVKLSMKNGSDSEVVGQVAAAIRGSAGQNKFYRKGTTHQPVGPETMFSMKNRMVVRDGKLIYCCSKGAKPFVLVNEAYKKPYAAQDYHLSNRSATAFNVYQHKLGAGEAFDAFFVMPRVPVADTKLGDRLKALDYASKRSETVHYWQDLFARCSFEIPEKRVNDSWRASLVHLMLATRAAGDGTGKRQGSGLTYDGLFLNDYMDMLLAYETGGFHEFSSPNVDWLLKKQHKSGLFIDVHNRGNNDIVTSHGQGLFALAYRCLTTRDKAYARRVYPAVKKAVEFTINDHLHHNKHGLIRPSIPYDAPMLTGYHTCHNLFALVGLRAGIRMARFLGHEHEADEWAKAERTYTVAILKAVDDVYQREGYIRSGLYDWKAGWVQGRKGNVNKHPNQDWENNLLLYPTELMSPNDPRVTKTLATIRARRYREGVMTYRDGMHIHQYVTVNQAHQYLVQGDQQHALLDLYHILLHNGSTHEGFENMVDPWTIRTPGASWPPPHAWAAAKIALFIRNSLVLEYGGDFGMEMAKRDLRLYSLISPAWTKAGQSVVIKNAPTEMGAISSTLSFESSGATLQMNAQFHTPPRYLVFRIPYFVTLSSYQANGKQAFENEGLLCLSPDTTEVSLVWQAKKHVHDNSFQKILKGYRSEYGYVEDGNYGPERAVKPFLLEDEKAYPAEPLSFDLVRKAFLKEYGRRYTEYQQAGGKPYEVNSPHLLSTVERKAE